MNRDRLNRQDEFRKSDIDETITGAKRDIETGAEAMKGKVVDVASRARQSTSQMGKDVSERLDRSREGAAGGLDRAADKLHEKTSDLLSEGKTSAVIHSFADRMESTADYLRQHDVEDMKNDVVEIVRKYPSQTLIGAVALGFLIGRAFRS